MDTPPPARRYDLFGPALDQLDRLAQKWKKHQQLQWFSPIDTTPWLAETPALVMLHEAGLELGPPRLPSCDTLLWSDRLPEGLSRSPGNETIALFGPDLNEVGVDACSVGRVTVVCGTFDQSYQNYTWLRDIVQHVEIKGIMSQYLPGDSRVWLRCEAGALRRGLSLTHPASAAAEALVRSPGVARVLTLWLVGCDEAVAQLRAVARQVRRTVEAMYFAENEPQMACEGCPHAELCAAVDGLKDFHLDRAALSRRKA